MTDGELPKELRDELLANRIATELIGNRFIAPDDDPDDYVSGIDPLSAPEAHETAERLLRDRRKVRNGNASKSARSRYQAYCDRYRGATGRDFESDLEEYRSNMDTAILRLGKWLW